MYGLFERMNGKDYIVEVFKTREKAEEERIYLQSDRDNLLIVKYVDE